MSNLTKITTQDCYKPLWLVREGDHALLKIEVSKGVWVTLIKEFIDSPFSHIIEPLGIIREIEKTEQIHGPSFDEFDENIRQVT